MQSFRELVEDYALSMWQRRWYAVVVAWSICLAGWAFVIQMPDVYESKARIYVDTESVLRPLLKGIVVDTNVLSEVELMQRTLLSTPNLTKISHMADLDLDAKTPLDQQNLITQLRRRVTITTEGPGLFSIAYGDPSPQTAKKVIESILNVFVESNLGNRRNDLVMARNFIDEQISAYQRQLDDIEKRMADFKAKNIDVLSGDQTIIGRLEAATAELQKTKVELAEARDKQSELRRQLADVPKLVETTNADSMGPDLSPPGDIAGSGPLGDAAVRVADLQKKLGDLLLSYTEQHPDVVRVKHQLELAQKELETEQDTKSKDAAPPDASLARGVKSTIPNPVYQEVKLQLVTLDTTIASLVGRMARNAEEVKKWQQLAQSSPELNAQMVRLGRDYEIIKRSYQELLNRREAAKMGQEMQAQTQTVSYRIIDPPELPRKPIGPNRPLFLGIVLIAGLMAGGGLAFVLVHVDDAIRNTVQLQHSVPFPLLGCVSLLRSELSRRQALVSTACFSLTVVGLLGVFGIMLAEVSYLRVVAQSVLKLHV